MVQELNKDYRGQLKKIKLVDILHCSPHDVRHNLRSYMTEELFYDQLFVEFKTYTTLREHFEDLFNNKASEQPFMYFLEGFAGAGKTTFLRWLCKTSTVKAYFAILDFNNSSTFRHTDGETFSGDDLLEDFFLNNLSKLYRFDEPGVERLFKVIHLNDMDLNSYFSPGFFPALSKHCNEQGLGKERYKELLNSIAYTDMILVLKLYAVLNLRKFVEFFCPYQEYSESIDEVVFVYDNLDSMRMEVKSSEIPKNIAALNYHCFIPITTQLDVFKSTITFSSYFCMRDAVYSVINPHHQDRFNLDGTQFKLQGDEANEIYEKRIGFAAGLKIDPSYLPHKIISKLLTDYYYISKSYLPLFNYNIRKFVLFLHRSAVQHGKESYLATLEEIYRDKDQRLVVGARGVVYHLIIKQLKANDFISTNLITREGLPAVRNGKGLLNIARLILTIIHNKNEYHLDMGRQEEQFLESGLFDVYEEFRVFYPNSTKSFLNTIASMFLFYNKNWCHLVTLSDKQIFDIDSFSEEHSKLVEYESLVARSDDITTNDQIAQIKSDLNTIKIRINPAGYCFLRDIARHYEYHSVKSGNEKPLFSCTGLVLRPKNNYEFEFQHNITNTKKAAIRCVSTLKCFLEETKGMKEFTQTEMCFRIYNDDHLKDEFDQMECIQTRQQGQLLLNRIIDLHTNYVDAFRRYLLSRTELLNTYAQTLNKDVLDVKRLINRFIANAISEYIDNYYFRLQDSVVDIARIQKANLLKIKQASKDSEFQLLINAGRDSW